MGCEQRERSLGNRTKQNCAATGTSSLPGVLAAQWNKPPAKHAKTQSFMEEAVSSPLLSKTRGSRMEAEFFRERLKSPKRRQDAAFLLFFLGGGQSVCGGQAGGGSRRPVKNGKKPARRKCVTRDGNADTESLHLIRLCFAFSRLVIFSFSALRSRAGF